MAFYNGMFVTIGNKLPFKLNRVIEGLPVIVLARLEAFNQMFSVKDRIAASMIDAAEREGKIDKETVIMEPTSWKSDIGFAFVCALKEYRLILTMPETMTLKRRKLLQTPGAELVLTYGTKGMKGAVEKAEGLAWEYSKSFIPKQFKNSANPEIHRLTIAEEIRSDTKGKVDIFVSGVGTGGTLTGAGKVLRPCLSALQIVVVEPAASSVLYGGNPGPHRRQGIGAGFIPEMLDSSLIN